mmetsp:Transcript_48642/g.105919  ORF Transcript_48642/g.105919 Transcript_48642/m.105919 type:complete len:210 (+) Transcript_48642:2460-3089(+)
MDKAAIVRVVVLWLVERFQDGHIPRIAGINLLRARVIHVDIHDHLHPSFMQKDHQLPNIFLGAIGWIHLGEILCPIAMVAMRHLIHHWRQDDAVHPKLLQITHFLHEARQVAAAVFIQFFTVLWVRRGKPIDEDLVHGHLWPGPGPNGQVMPFLLRGVLWHIPHTARESTQSCCFLDVRLVLVLDVGLVEEFLVALDLFGATILSAPLA